MAVVVIIDYSYLLLLSLFLLSVVLLSLFSLFLSLFQLRYFLSYLLKYKIHTVVLVVEPFLRSAVD